MRNISDKICTENKNIFYVQSFFSKIVSLMGQCEKNMVQPDIMPREKKKRFAWRINLLAPEFYI